MKGLEALFEEFKANGLHKELSELDIEQHDGIAWMSHLTAFATGSVSDMELS